MPYPILGEQKCSYQSGRISLQFLDGNSVSNISVRKTYMRGWGCSSGEECFPGMHNAQGLIHSTMLAWWYASITKTLHETHFYEKGKEGGKIPSQTLP